MEYKSTIKSRAYLYKESKKASTLINKGGGHRRWYGTMQNIVLVDEFCKNENTFFKVGLTWSDISSNKFGCRIHMKNSCYNNVGKLLFVNNKHDLEYICGYLNSKVAFKFIDILTPGLHFDIGYISKVPINYNNIEKVRVTVNNNIGISKLDWDSFEISWEDIA